MLFVLAGAPGSGETAALAAVRQRLPGVVSADMDAFLDAASALAGGSGWPAAAWPSGTSSTRWRTPPSCAGSGCR